MTYDEWFETYKPVTNTLVVAPFDGRMWETYGSEESVVKASLPEHVWTILDTDGGLVLTSGRHYVDRVGYFICEVPFVPTDDVPWLDIPFET